MMQKKNFPKAACPQTSAPKPTDFERKAGYGGGNMMVRGWFPVSEPGKWVPITGTIKFLFSNWKFLTSMTFWAKQWKNPNTFIYKISWMTWRPSIKKLSLHEQTESAKAGSVQTSTGTFLHSTFFTLVTVWGLVSVNQVRGDNLVLMTPLKPTPSSPHLSDNRPSAPQHNVAKCHLWKLAIKQGQFSPQLNC